MACNPFAAQLEYLELMQTHLEVRIDLFIHHMEVHGKNAAMQTELEADQAQLADIDDQYAVARLLADEWADANSEPRLPRIRVIAARAPEQLLLAA